MVIDLNLLAKQIEEVEDLLEIDCLVDNRYIDEREYSYLSLKFNLKTILVKRKKIKNKRYIIKRKYRYNSFNPFAGLTQEEVAEIVSLTFES